MFLVAQNERRTPTQKGDRVVFLMSAAFIPESEAVRTAFADTSEVEGEIVSLSDSGMALGVFAVVEVTRKQKVVVPVENLRLLGSAKSEW